MWFLAFITYFIRYCVRVIELRAHSVFRGIYNERLTYLFSSICLKWKLYLYISVFHMIYSYDKLLLIYFFRNVIRNCVLCSCWTNSKKVSQTLTEIIMPGRKFAFANTSSTLGIIFSEKVVWILKYFFSTVTFFFLRMVIKRKEGRDMFFRKQLSKANSRYLKQTISLQFTCGK